ncbi:MAG: HlyD family efflux transporter periplasmic adaptor subunit [Lachnospiraceae bacterium]|nr:HlyD family efflux transporter periplasmic adaptor subunit [Lachnospiraceae bacterium]
MKERLKKDKKFRRKLILAAAALILLLGACIYTLFIKPNLSNEVYIYKEETVARGDLVLGIMESGSLSFGESSVTYDLDLELDDDDDDDSDDDEDSETTKYLEIEEVYVVSGQRIEEGDLLFKLTDSSVSSVRRKLSSALTEARITLSNAQAEYDISMLSAKSTYDSSVKAGNRANADFQAAITASEQKVKGLEAEIAVLELEIAVAEEMLADEDLLESYENAKTAYTTAKETYEETDLHNSTAYTSNLTAYQTAKSQLEALEDELQRYSDTITDNQAEIEKKQQEIEDAKVTQILENQEAVNNYNSASLEGELAEEIYNYSTNSLSEAVNQAQTELDEIQGKMDAFEEFVGGDNQIYASEGGLVTNVRYEAGDELISEGAMLTYAKADEYQISIDVSEEDVAAISVGDSVELVFTAYPEQLWEGRIISITTTASSEHATTISYPVDILVLGDTELLYGGMTADVTFVTDSVTDVLYVSKKAVFEENGVSYVYKKDASGNRVKAAVETGFSDTASIEIVSGLEEGDIVYIESVMNKNAESSSGSTEATEEEPDMNQEDGSDGFGGRPSEGGFGGASPDNGGGMGNSNSFGGGGGGPADNMGGR